MKYIDLLPWNQSVINAGKYLAQVSGRRHFQQKEGTGNPLFFRLLSLAMFLAFFLFSYSRVSAQGAISAVWAMSSSTTSGSSVSGAGSSTVVAGTMTPGSVFNSGAYNTDGYKCTSTSTWPTAATTGYYLDFPLSPGSNYDLSLSSLSFTIKISGGSGAMTVGFAYQIDGGSFTTAGSTNTGTSNATYNLSLSGLNVACGNGHTMVVRAYVYAVGATTSSRNVYIKNMTFAGATTSSSGGGTSPALTVSPASLSFGSVTINTTSSQQAYTISGSNLTPTSGSITVTAPSGFQVSATSGSGFASSLSVAYSGATLASTTIYTRFAPAAAQSYSGSVTNAGGGAATQNVTVSGTGTSGQAPSSTAIYVSPSGSDANAGSFSAPYKTITKAVSVAVAGDTIYVRGGTHTYTTTIGISKNGTSSARYYLLAYPGERPVLDFSGMSVSSSNRGMSVSGSYWYIKGIDFYKAGDNGMFVSGSNNVVEFCSFYENYDTGLQLGGGASNNQVINCDSYFNADPDNGDADGFAVKLDVGSGNYYYGCRAWQNSDDGWDGYLRGADNVSTTLENCWCFRNGYLKSGSASSGNGNGFKMGGSDDKDLMHNFTLKNCLAFYNRVKGFDQNNNKGSMILYNCTGYSNGTNYSISSALNSGKTATVTNGISAGSGSVSLGSFVVQTTNSWQSPFSVSNADFVSVDTAGVRGARNADGSLPNVSFMHLATGSDLINAGTNVGLPYNGSAPDLGCFETSSGMKQQLQSDRTMLITYPNPFRGAANIRFSVATAGRATIKVYSTTGQVVAVVFDDNVTAGVVYDIPFVAKSLAAGLYICVLENSDTHLIHKMVVLE